MEHKRVIRNLFIIWFASLISYLIKYVMMQKEFQLEGKIDVCCCQFSQILENNQKITDKLNEISNTRFFRIFQVNLQKECPFWAVDYMCQFKDSCNICECDNYPSQWKNFKTDDIIQEKSIIINKNFGFFEFLSDPGDDGIFVDLKKNQEGFTGYQGQKIWDIIYKENLFNNDNQVFFKKILQHNQQCFEERMLYRIVSGMHTSISTQLTEFYKENDRVFPNSLMYFEKVGDHQDRIKNLFFLQSILIKGFQIFMEKVNLNTDIMSDDIQSDIDAKLILQSLQSEINKCGNSFDEIQVFSIQAKQHLQQQFQQYFTNITRLMDCVECEKCKVWGKLQFYGIGLNQQINQIILGVALKMIFRPQKLNRNEMIAFVNTFAKVSHSISAIQKMHDRRTEVKLFELNYNDISKLYYQLFIKRIHIQKLYSQRTWRLMYVYFFPTFVFLCFLIFADKVNREMKVKIRKMFKNVPFE